MHCAFQRLDGEATPDGLWLTSTVADPPNARFRVKAVAVGRNGDTDRGLLTDGAGDECPTILSVTGDVSVEGQTVRFTRPGLVEEYSVSMDGVQQNFLVLEKPGDATVPAFRLSGSPAPRVGAELCVGLAVTGARVEQTAWGAQLVLERSRRKVAYSRLKVTDANGKQLPARLEAAGDSAIRNPQSAISLAVVVDDAAAAYPVRIDPTFSDANWISLGGIPGANGFVYASVVDGAGNLYIGGSFTIVGDAVANNIAKWNGCAWTALGSGMGGSYPAVWALAVSGSNVYAGGSFTNAGGVAATNVARWDGSAWSALGSGLGVGTGSYLPVVSALAVSGSDLYAGGSFTTAGAIAATNIAKWDGSAWSVLGPGMNDSVLALAVLGTDLYAGGYFTTAGGVSANYVAKWSGSAWSALGLMMGGGTWPPGVKALAISGSDLYAGGSFMTLGGVTATNIAKWDGSFWSPLGSGIEGDVYPPVVNGLAVSGSDLYAGWSTNAGCAAGGCGGGIGGVAKWNGSTWSALGSELGGVVGAAVYTVAASGTDVFAGGYFTMAGASPVNYIAKWNGSGWIAMGSGMGGGNGEPLIPTVKVLAASGSNVYVGGTFITARTMATNIARWDGNAWSALGSGMGGAYPSVAALAVSGSDLYAGGSFTTAGSVEANYIAKWDGNAWSALASGMGGAYASVTALAVSGSNLYAGGSFTTAGGIAANYIAKWNGSAWSALGSGMNGWVYALALSGSNVYAGGAFTTAGGSPATNIAKWDGSAWSALGSGLDYQVNALAVWGSDLYAGGYFDNAGGISANYIAKWNGSTWSALGSGVNYYVSALAVSGSDLYAGGNLYTAGGSPVNGIAKWDGSSWRALGSGVNGLVATLAVSGADLYVGGAFTSAGGKVSGYTAKAIIGPSFYFVTTNTSLGLSNGQFYFTLVGPAGSNAVIFASTNLQTWTSLATNPLTGGSLNFTDNLATNYPRRLYRALLQP